MRGAQAEQLLKDKPDLFSHHIKFVPTEVNLFIPVLILLVPSLPHGLSCLMHDDLLFAEYYHGTADYKQRFLDSILLGETQDPCSRGTQVSYTGEGR